MKNIHIVLLIFFFLLLSLTTACRKSEKEGEEKAAETAAAQLSPQEELGKMIFFDTNLSEPAGQACATCHGSAVGWSGPDSDINAATAVYPGALEPRFGNRKPPAAAYAGNSPILYRDEEGTFVGGMFWDGRADGSKLGDPLAEQAMGPFLNPLEQNNPDEASVIKKIQASSYADLFKEVWGPDSLSLDDIKGTYERIARSIAAFERSQEVNPFSSKFDDFWRKAREANLDVAAIDEGNWQDYQNLGFDEAELKGLMLFNTTGLCAECHVLTSENGQPPLFTDFTYDNLGAPKNPDNPFYTQDQEWNPDGKDWVDNGLGAFLENHPQYQEFAAENMGKYKVPTLRNVDKRPREGFVKAFLHNGFFKTLKDVVHFYNTRDLADAEWPDPEISVNINEDELGDLGLTEEEEDLIVQFMKTLTDK
jgi:cytochrome c peroxidase